MSSRTQPAALPPSGLPGLDPFWSRLVTAVDSEGVERTWHVLDNGVEDAEITLLCVHGNPTWSYLWRKLLSGAPSGVRVVAVDHLDMGYSERTGTLRRMQQRIDDLAVAADALDIRGPVVIVAHDWGGPISLGWAAGHREQLAGIVLMNTAVHQPAGSPAPTLIRMARSKSVLGPLSVRTSGFLKGTLRLTSNRPSRPVREAYLAPYQSAARRPAIGAFVADIPLEEDHPSRPALSMVTEALNEMTDVPTLLLWGSADPVFSDLYLRDLQSRLPQAEAHRFAKASHLLPEDVDIASPIFEWLSGFDTDPDPGGVRTERPSMWAAIERRRDDPEPAVAEMDGTEVTRSVSFAELADDVGKTARGLSASGVRRGDRVALLVPPGIDLTVCLYACWRMGAVVVVVDAGLGAGGMTRALKSAAPDYVIGINKALAAARSMRWPGKRIAVEPLGRSRRGALGVWASLDEIKNRGADVAEPPEPDADDAALVVFTSGATGPAKGVTYRHHQAQANRDALAEVYDIGPDDRLVAAFGPFALYGPALGITSVVPDMEVTSPGTLTATALAGAAAAVDATMVFASPAALKNVVATAGDLTPALRSALGKTRKLMSAGAPVPAELLREVARLVPNADLHTPYGMTEVLPVADITLRELEEVGIGDGVCVGFPAPGVEIAISALDGDGAATGDLVNAANVVGEVCIKAPHAKDEYDRLWITQHASAEPGGWHRSGDVGHLDDTGRLWIEGRLFHIMKTAHGIVTPVAIEHAVEALPGFEMAAAVGVGPAGTQQVVVAAVPDEPVRRPRVADAELAATVRRAVAVDVAAVLLVPELPVDKRHNSKIDRTRVAEWAERVLAGGRVGRI